MPRRDRLLPDKMYHVYVGAHGEANLFSDSAESATQPYNHFLKTYAQLIEPVAETFAYCLLPDHFHFFVRIKTIAEQIEDWYFAHSAENPRPHTAQSLQTNNLANC